jgi:outer membrane biosynthesis protein TonB
MITAASGGALVAGGASAPSAPDAVRVRVLRSFIWAREPVSLGEELTLPRRFAREMASFGKAEILPDEPAPEPEPEPETPAPEPKPEPKPEPPAPEPPPADLLAEPEAATASRSTRKDRPA